MAVERICLACSRLDTPGGVERAVVNCANLFHSRGHRVTVLVLDQTAVSFYPLTSGIEVVQAPLFFGIALPGNAVTRKVALIRDIIRLRRLLRCLEADIVIGSEYSITVPLYFAARRSHTAVYAWEHHHFHWLKKNRFWNLLFRWVYPRLRSVVCNNTAEKKLFDALGCRTVLIPNVVPAETRKAVSLENPMLLTVGWLIKRKGIDLIPAIAHLIFTDNSHWQWKIIGTGEELPALQSQLKEKELTERVIVEPPVSHHLENVYSQTSICVMTSRFECLPMVLLEATSHGIPCVAFDCPTGLADIIADGKTGYLTPLENVETIANRIKELMKDQDKRKAMGAAAYEASVRYTPERIYEEWRKLFKVQGS